ncbi:hypothetical protein RF11_11046 [Thelohanellus kitauei]|uniref:Uncharacterized protein n=1 Tax=Thelohanellus kitauei TaxID=669202 RepID=A0A0C2N641_THEKT|nr:hypothetical protein RF11_11046 [Thelohanellus kitauei]
MRRRARKYIDRVIRSKNPSQTPHHWLIAEFFHSINDLILTKNAAEQLTHFSKCKTRRDFLAYKRVVFKRPRRFSPRFIDEHLFKLNELSRTLSAIAKGCTPEYNKIQLCYTPIPLVQGADVMVLIRSRHPMVVAGTIESTNFCPYDYKIRLRSKIYGYSGILLGGLEYLGANSSDVMPIPGLSFVKNRLPRFQNEPSVTESITKGHNSMARYKSSGMESVAISRSHLIFDMVKMSKFMAEKKHLLSSLMISGNLAEMQITFQNSLTLSTLIGCSSKLLSLSNVNRVSEYERTKDMKVVRARLEGVGNLERLKMNPRFPKFTSNCDLLADFCESLITVPFKISNVIINLLSYLSTCEYDGPALRLQKIHQITQTIIRSLPSSQYKYVFIYLRLVYEIEAQVCSMYNDSR